MSDVSRRSVLRDLAGGAAAIAAFTTRRALAAAAAVPDPIRIAGLASADGGSVSLSSYCYVLDQQGWLRSQLAARHLGLQWFATAHEATGPMINEAFASGAIQFGIYGDLPSAILNAGGVETRLLVPNGVGGQECFLVVPTSSTARSLEDLKGKTLAIHRGRPWELPLLRLLDSRKLSYKDFKVYNMNPNAGMAAIAAKRVDALFTTLDAYILEAKGVGKIIWSTKTAPLDWRMRTELFAAKTFIDQYPDLTQTVVTAYVKAAYWASQPGSRETMIKVASKAERSEAVIRRSYDDDTFSWKDKWSPLFNDFVYDHYRNTVALAVDKKLIPRPIDVNKWLDPRFVNTALRELNLTHYWQPVSNKA
jgi:sulfonate transport system substrate-binding protein